MQMRSVEEGKRLHGRILKLNFNLDIFLVNSIVSMYVKCGHVADARQVFDKMPERNDVSWNAIIAGCAQHGEGEEALNLFCQMQGAGHKPTSFTFASVLKACATLTALEEGKQVHSYAINAGFEADVFVGSSLVDMYAKCGTLKFARKVFDMMPERHVVSCNAMISGYAQKGYAEDALKLFAEIRQAGLKATHITFAGVLSACACIPALQQGEQVHAHILKTGLEKDILVGNNLVNLYAKSGNVEDARHLFDNMSERDVVSWNAMIAGNDKTGHSEEVLKLFCQMQRANMKPNQFTFASVLSSCANNAALGEGKQMHACITKTRFGADVLVGNALVDVYAKCSSVKDAQNVFDKMVERNTTSWNAIIAGYLQNAQAETALNVFYQMLLAGVKPDQFTFASIVNACASLATLEQAKQVQSHIVKLGYIYLDVVLGNALIDMYAKCGNIHGAQEVFNQMPKLDMVSWTSIIVGYAQHGQGREALLLFQEMQWAGIQPNHVTFIGVLFACSQVGLVDEGLRYFDSMCQDNGITARMEHYACIVDLLGRAGLLVEARDFINKMPYEPNALVWRSMLGACRIHGNLELARDAAEHILELEPKRAATFVLLSNIYAAAGKWNDVARVRKMMKDRDVKKEPGHSWIEMKNGVHSFVVGNRSHPQAEEIYEKLDRLTVQMKQWGYVPDPNFALPDVERE